MRDLSISVDEIRPMMIYKSSGAVKILNIN